MFIESMFVVCGLFRILPLAYAPQSAPTSQSRPSVAAVASRTVQDSGDWSMFRGNLAQTGVSREELADELRVIWKVELKEPIESTAAIVGQTAYIGSDDMCLYALQLSDGAIRWKYKATDAIKAAPTVAGGVVYVGDEAGVMHAVDAADGASKWRFPTSASIISSVAAADGRLYFGSYNGKLYCLSAADGKEIWNVQTGDKLHGTPALMDGFVLAAGCDGALHVANANDGVQTRELKLGAVTGASPACVGSTVFLPTQGCQVLAIDWKAEKLLWMFEDKDRQFPYQASSAVRDEWVIIAGRDKRVRGLDAKTGQQKWEFVTRGRIDGSPVLAGRRVFVPGGDGNLYVLDLATGHELWHFEAGGFGSSPAIAHGRLVIGSLDGVVYCLGAK